MTHIDADIIIFGAGAAGLWLLNRLTQLGYRVVLLETHSIGAGQTIHSQGIIHGGMKYSLKGKLTQATESIAMMPKRWLDCLCREGEINLSEAMVLSEHHYFWSPHKLGAKVLGFFAKQMLNARLQTLPKNAQPAIFQHPNFSGLVYELNEFVLDVPSLLQVLAKNVMDHIYHIQSGKYAFIHDESGIKGLNIQSDNQSIHLLAKHFIFAAGAGNENLLQQIGLTQPAMQRRPLHMVMLKHQNLLPIYAHCLGHGSKPRVTITTHRHQDGNWIWYIGGELAESGVDLPQHQQIERAKTELIEVLPWIDLKSAHWQSFLIDRAEPLQKNLFRPDNAFVSQQKNIFTVWPTKLALTPQLSDQLLQKIQEQAIKPSDASMPKLTLAKPTIAEPVWDRLFS